MKNRVLSIVEIEELVNGIEVFAVDGDLLHVHMDGNYLGLRLYDIYLEANTDDLLEFRNSKLWLSYYRQRKKVHALFM